MVENGLDPKLLAMDHAASYRAIKNGNIKKRYRFSGINANVIINDAKEIIININKQHNTNNNVCCAGWHVK